MATSLSWISPVFAFMAELAFPVNSGHMYALFLDSSNILTIIFWPANQKTHIMDQSSFQPFTEIIDFKLLCGRADDDQ